MSYDVSIYGSASDTECICKCGHVHTRVSPEELFEENHTSNTSQMWRDAGVDLRDWDGKRAGDLIDPLRAAIAGVESRPDHCRRYEPNNGWGSYESTLRFLYSILRACEQYPDGKLSISS